MTTTGIPTILLTNRNALQKFKEVRPHLAILSKKAERATYAALTCLNKALAHETAWNREWELSLDPQILAALKNQNYEYLKNIGFGFERLATTRVFLLQGESVAAVKDEVYSDAVNSIEAQHSFYNTWLVGKYRENWKLWYYAPVGYHTLDLEGNITVINYTGAVTMLGYKSPQALVGRSIFDLVLPEQRAMAEQRFKEKRNGKQVPPTQDRVYVRESGSWIYVSARDQLNYDPQGNVIGIKTALVDVTLQKQVEEQLYELMRIKGLQQLASGLSDGINNPLMGISGAAQYLEGWLSRSITSRNDEFALKRVREIQSCCDSLKRLNDMLTGFSGIKQPKFGTIDPRMISHYINTDFVKPDNIELSITDGASWRIKGDNQLFEAVMHLVNNAKDAIGDKSGKIEITLRNIEYQNEVKTNSGILPAGKYVMIAVRDNGIGISGKEQKKIFDPFYTTKSARDSKGWGLAVTLGVIVRSCSGGINLWSEEGKGSIFTLLIPAFDPAK